MEKKSLKYYLLLISALYILCTTVYSQSSFVETIHFKTNSYSIDKKYHKTLNQIAKQLSADTSGFLKIFGFADTIGSKKYNDIISGKRALAVYEYLKARALVDSSKYYVTWIGEGGQDIAYDLHFPSANIQKRCVDIWVTFYKNQME